MRGKLSSALGPLLGLLLFAAALWVIHGELAAHHVRDILHATRSIPAWKAWLAAGLTAAGYLSMTGYDALTLVFLGRPLEYRKTAFASFISYAFSNNIGFAMLAGGSIRYRLYSAWGLSFWEITKVITFCTVSLWLGFFALGGAAFLLEPGVVARATSFPAVSVRLLGIAFLLTVAVYLGLSAFYRKPIAIRGRELALPPLRISLSQLAVAAADWTLAGSVLYALLPASAGAGFFGFLGAFLFAQLAGLSSQVPGGLGVFEVVILLFLSGSAPPAQVMGALLAYRVLYYLAPLTIAAALLGIQEALRKREGITKAARVLVRWQTVLVPNVLALAVFAAGAVLLFSGAIPSPGRRLLWVRELLPLSVVEASHFLGSLTGTGLILLARGIQRRLDAAYYLTAALLCGGVIFALLRGFDYDEAFLMAVLLAALAPCRDYFHRRASLVRERFTFEWTALVILVLTAVAWLTFFSYRHVEYRSELWWRFAFLENAPRSLRALAGAVTAAFVFGVVRLLSPAAPSGEPESPPDAETVAAIAAASPETYANLVFLGDKSLMLSQDRKAFIMYRVEGRSWVAMGDPVGPPGSRPELAARFLDAADAHGGWPVFYEVGAENLGLYVDLGLNLFKMGEEARVPLADFSLLGRSRKNLRHELNRIEAEGFIFEVLPPERVPAVMGDLKRVSDAWLAHKKTREKGFSLGFFNEDYLARFPVAIVRKGQEISAFANVWQSGGKREISVDLMRYVPGGPAGVMNYLFVSLMQWGRNEGWGHFNLGMAPLSGFGDKRQKRLWNRVGAFLYRHGDQFYNFQGLRRFKEKFTPEWTPRYIAFPGSLKAPLVLSNIAALVSGGKKGVFGK